MYSCADGFRLTTHKFFKPKSAEYFEQDIHFSSSLLQSSRHNFYSRNERVKMRISSTFLMEPFLFSHAFNKPVKSFPNPLRLS